MKANDDAARGEEFSKGTSHVVIAAISAAVLVSIAIAIYVIAGQKPPVAAGEVVQVWAWPHLAESSGVDANGAEMAKQSFDQVMLFADIRIHNQSKQPLFLRNVLANITLADGIHSSYAAGPADYERVFLAYPKIAVPHGKALDTQATIDPGQTIEGVVVSTFHMSKQDWDARKGLDFTVGLRYQNSLKLASQSPVTMEP